MRTLSTTEDKILGSRQYNIIFRVFVEDGDGSFQNLRNFKGTDWLMGASYQDDIDNESASATITLWKRIGRDTLAPYIKNARTNLNASAAWDPIVDVGRQMYIEVRYGSDDTHTSSDWKEVFRGYIDEVEWGAEEVILNCRDQNALLQDTFIEVERKYSSNTTPVAVETVMQQILDDNLGVGTVSLYTPSSPGWLIGKFWSEKQSVYDELSKLSDQIGWRVRYIWDSGTSAFRLTLYEPDRTDTTSVRTFNADDYFSIDMLSLSIENIRNVINVKYHNVNKVDDEGNPLIRNATVQDSDSIILFGRRWAGVTEKAGSNIDTEAEAEAFAQAILDDLKLPKATKSVTMRYFFAVELWDVYTFSANDEHYSNDFVGSVTGFKHELSNNQIRTTIDVREDTPIGRSVTWVTSFGMPGVAPLDSDQLLSLERGTNTDINTGFGSAQLDNQYLSDALDEESGSMGIDMLYDDGSVNNSGLAPQRGDVMILVL